MTTCPSCGGRLDGDGICDSCGALARGFFGALDVGAPQVADAVARGLDFYQLLEVPSDAELRAVARRYRRLRAIFPDDPRHLAPEPARRLALLELAGRVLTDPRLRAAYDAQRAAGAGARVEVLRCAGCGAPLGPAGERCAFCGTPRPAAPAAPQPPPDDAPAPADLVDYYALLGLNADHLYQPPPQPALRSPLGLGAPGGLDLRGHAAHPQPPAPEDVDAAALARQRPLLTAARMSPEDRDARLREIEVARRILRSERLRAAYDAIVQGIGQGRIHRGTIEALHQLQESVAREIREDEGQPEGGRAAGELVRQAEGYIAAGVPRDALAPLRRALAADPQDGRASRLFAEAALAADDPLSLGGHTLRQVQSCIAAAERAGDPVPGGAALAALCAGLEAREAGRHEEAERRLQEATRIDPRLAPAWRGLAAIAMGRGESRPAAELALRAAEADPADERALLLAAAALLRGRRRAEAREVAGRIAGLRGGGAPDAILAELA